MGTGLDPDFKMNTVPANKKPELVSTFYTGWGSYQDSLIKALAPLKPEQLALRAAPGLRSMAESAAHIIGARARWFYLLMGEGGDEFKELGRWDQRGARARGAEELVHGLATTWDGMHAAIDRWSPQDWQLTWPGEDASEPETITRAWVIWHLVEHDLHHGGEISITLGMNGLRGIAL